MKQESLRLRDLTLIQREGIYEVVACDSCGGVGEKSLDHVKAPPEVVGYFTARVPLMEVMSVGAVPFVIINTVSAEMEPTGRRILAGIQQLITEAALPLEAINGSTEENFTMEQTAMGVTVIGQVPKEKLRASCSQKGSLIGAVGIPKMGDAIEQPRDKEVCSLESLKRLVGHTLVKEIIPVGSKGVHYEATLMASLNQCSFQPEEKLPYDLAQSAGPATVVIFSVAPEDMAQVRQVMDQPIFLIGRLV